MGGWAGVFASRLAPTGNLAGLGVALAGLASSRASSLPQVSRTAWGGNKAPVTVSQKSLTDCQFLQVSSSFRRAKLARLKEN